MKICLEYVSANPNSPITVQHARAGIVGDILARVLTHQGHQVTREFYVNDAPGPTLTAFARHVAAETDPFAAEIAHSARGATLSDIIAAVRVRQSAALSAIGVGFDSYVSEADLLSSGAVDRLLTDLTASGSTTWRGGALWLKTTGMGDEQDRPLIRPQGGPSYLATDLTYHRDKVVRGFDSLIDLWDADHGAYIARTRAGLAALGSDPDKLRVGLVAPVRILKEGQERRVGKYGAFVTLEELLPQTTPERLRGWCASVDPTIPLDINLDEVEAPFSVRPLSLEAAVAALPTALEQVTATLSPRPLAEVAQCLKRGLENTSAAPSVVEAAQAALQQARALLGL